MARVGIVLLMVVMASVVHGELQLKETRAHARRPVSSDELALLRVKRGELRSPGLADDNGGEAAPRARERRHAANAPKTRLTLADGDESSLERVKRVKRAAANTLVSSASVKAPHEIASRDDDGGGGHGDAGKRATQTNDVAKKHVTRKRQPYTHDVPKKHNANKKKKHAEHNNKKKTAAAVKKTTRRGYAGRKRLNYERERDVENSKHNKGNSKHNKEHSKKKAVAADEKSKRARKNLKHDDDDNNKHQKKPKGARRLHEIVAKKGSQEDRRRLASHQRLGGGERSVTAGRVSNRLSKQLAKFRVYKRSVDNELNVQIQRLKKLRKRTDAKVKRSADGRRSSD